MIIFDFETTGLLGVSSLPATSDARNKQARATQLCAIKIDDVTFQQVDQFHSFFDPFPTPVLPDAAKVSGLSTEYLRGQPTFASKYKELATFFLGERRLVAHNLAFDRDILFYELARIGRQIQFPWPVEHVCTVELTEHIKGYRMKLGELHEHLFGEGFKEAHDARADTAALARCYIALLKADV